MIMEGLKPSNGHPPPNPLEPAVGLVESSNPHLLNKTVHPQQIPMTEDSAVTKAEKFERHGIADGVEESSSTYKRRKLDSDTGNRGPTQSERQKGVAPIKKESVAPMPSYHEPAYAGQIPLVPGWYQT